MNVYRSHDRALPEIPASASGVASTDDDDEEDEGHYDVISKNRRAAAAAAGVSSNSRTQKPRFCHPYETVAGDSDSTYAGIREELEAAISLRNSRLRANDSSTAAVVAAGSSSDPPYAGIMGDSNNDAQTSAPGVSLRPRIPSTYSVTVSNQQQQRSHGSEHVGETDRTLSVGVRADNDAESPLLPPRNGTIDGVDGGPSSVATCSVSNTWTHLTAAVSTLSTGAVNSSPNVTTTSASAAANDDPIAHVQDQLQLLHVGASGDAMPVSGTLILWCCFVDICVSRNKGPLSVATLLCLFLLCTLWCQSECSDVVTEYKGLETRLVTRTNFGLGHEGLVRVLASSQNIDLSLNLLGWPLHCP